MSTVIHPLGRHVEHDERSRAFAVEPVAKLVDAQWTRRAPIWNQGNLGSCTGNAGLGAVGTGPLYDALLRAKALVPPPLTEREAVAVYSAATKRDSIAGSYPPIDTGSSGLAVAKVLKSMGFIDSYSHAFSFQAALSAIMSGPVIVGVNWYEGFDEPHNGECVLAGDVRGGHELCVDRLDVTNQRVVFANSWGRGWGLGV